ncbi:MAG TPA: hypothetical protein VKM55_03065 [Candidatus Lokiarchaeia archaeon]|nr:hypothetical protein [Candidatus Lokiarchaeia archaeon]
MSEEVPKLYIVWKGELKQVDKPIFSTGDSYLLDAGTTVFLWLGEGSSTDEKETAAIEAHKLEVDRAVQIISIDQGQESDEFFNALVPIGSFRLVEKNLVGSMLVDVETGSWAGHMDHVDALYRVSSEDFEGDINKMQYVQVPFENGSLDSGNVYIADLGDEILVWIGSGSNVKERMMAGRWAYKFDAERAGAQPILYYDEGEDAKFMDKCWGAGIVKSTSKFAQFSLEKAPVEQGEANSLDEEIVNVESNPLEEESTEMESQLTEDEPVAAFAEEDGEEAEVSGEAGQRWQCPKCGNNLRSMIREVTDKTVVLSTYPPIYGKKLICGKCGKEWRQAG